MALFSNLEKLDMVSNAALQSLILVSAITLTKRKPEGLKMKMPSGSIQDLSKTEIKQRLSYLLTISQVLFHKSHSFVKLDQKKVARMHKDFIKIVGELLMSYQAQKDQPHLFSIYLSSICMCLSEILHYATSLYLNKPISLS